MNELIKEQGLSSTFDITIKNLENERNSLAQKVKITPDEIIHFNEVERNIENLELENEKLQLELDNHKKISNVFTVVPGYFSCSDEF